MQAYLAFWFDALPPAALALEVLMLVLTIVLVRSSMHPSTFALVSWVGTVTHEASHGIVGLVLGAKPCELSLFPKQNADGSWTLGYVAFSNMRWWNAPFTAMAPMLLAPLAIWLVADWAYPFIVAGDTLGSLWRTSICSIIFQASWPSKQDFKVAAPGLAVIIFLLWLFN
ncbi:major facilitator transporter [Novimethylophilus kurashikiensis]|uniref:Major facilitator transporter n=1 Tax=Novimethylophilus kurashikiensis TaxID=1825523 RepID=A0A2R5F7Y9_9PROT|nr:hypothetical protein [Novimethylophilus kurashikiensis]GBG14360.1 major facilitator transporter [Novimethylophilus kurashikiensis]